MRYHGIDIPYDRIAEFCRSNRIRKLALYGSILRDDFGPDSDIDVLIEFEPASGVGLFGLTQLQEDLSQLLGHRVDLNTPGFFSERIREQVQREAALQYDSSEAA